MKKLALAILTTIMACSFLQARESNETLNPTLVVQGTSAITIYAVGGGTVSAAACQVFVGSMSVTTTGGLYPGTTWFVLSDANKDTLTELVTHINGVASTVVGTTLVATLVNGAYDANPSTELTATASQSILTSTLVKTLGVTRTLGISYTLPTTALGWRQQYRVTGLSANATYTTGTVTLNVYNGAAVTNTNILRYKLNATTTETPIAMPYGGEFAGSNDTAMRFDVIGSSWVSAGYINIQGYKK